MIQQRNLSRLSNRLAERGGRRIPEAVLNRDYCLSWFLIGLAQSPLREPLVFKGGTALKKCYFPSYRFSQDLDFTLTTALTFDELRVGLEPVFEHARRAAAVRLSFDQPDRHPHQGSHTFFLGYEGPLPPHPSQTVKVDVTLREALVYPVAERAVLRTYPEYEDLPEGVTVHAYSLEEVAAEKVVALLDKARNEPRDLYDIWFLTEQGHVELGDLRHAVDEKLVFRGRTLEQVADVFQAKEAGYEKRWKERLGEQMSELPEFAEVFRAVRRTFRQAGLIGGR